MKLKKVTCHQHLPAKQSALCVTWAVTSIVQTGKNVNANILFGALF